MAGGGRASSSAIRVKTNDRLDQEARKRRGDPQDRQLINRCAQRLKKSGSRSSSATGSRTAARGNPKHMFPDLPERNLGLE
jgi:hypothetical protein